MPQAANVVINDGSSDVTFKPKAVDGGLATFQDDTSSLVSGRPEITASHRLAKSSAPAKTRLVLKVPVEEIVDSVTQVTRESTVIIEVLTSPESSSAERTALRTLAADLLGDAIVASMIDDGERVW